MADINVCRSLSLFSFARRCPGLRNAGRKPFPTKNSQDAFHHWPTGLPHLPVNREIRPMTAVPRRGVAFAFGRHAVGLTASAVLSCWERSAVHIHCRLGSGFIPMTEGLWLIHVSEPVTETIS